MFTDTHCHILKEYYENIEEIIDRAKKNGIMKMIVNGIDRKSNEEVLELQKKYDCIYAAIGFHPENISPKAQFKTHGNINFGSFEASTETM